MEEFSSVLGMVSVVCGFVSLLWWVTRQPGTKNTMLPSSSSTTQPRPKLDWDKPLVSRYNSKCSVCRCDTRGLCEKCRNNRCMYCTKLVIKSPPLLPVKLPVVKPTPTMSVEIISTKTEKEEGT